MRGRAATPEAEKARRQKISRAMKKRVKIGAYRDERGRFISREQWYAMKRAEEARRQESIPEVPVGFAEPEPGGGQIIVVVLAGYRHKEKQSYVSAEEHVMWIYPIENNPDDLRRRLNDAHPDREYFEDKKAKKEGHKARQPVVIEVIRE